MKILLCLLFSVLFTSCSGDLLRVSDTPKFAFLFIVCITIGAFLGYVIGTRPITAIPTRGKYIVKKKIIPCLFLGIFIGGLFSYILGLMFF